MLWFMMYYTKGTCFAAVFWKYKTCYLREESDSCVRCDMGSNKEEENMPELNRIGEVNKEGNRIYVYLKSEYKKGMKHMDSFSHIHLLVIAGEERLTFLTGGISEMDFSSGRIVLSVDAEHLRVEDKEFPLCLVDMKPYMPSEDCVPAKNAVISADYNSAAR